jgi:hypothetical protein
MRRGLKQRRLDMALGDLLPDTRSGGPNPDQRMDVRPRTSDVEDRWVLCARAMSIMTSCGDGGLHGCLGAPVLS